MKRRLWYARAERVRFAAAVLLCAHVGHRRPLLQKFDGGRRPWLCRRCRVILGYGPTEPEPVLSVWALRAFTAAEVAVLLLVVVTVVKAGWWAVLSGAVCLALILGVGWWLTLRWAR